MPRGPTNQDLLARRAGTTQKDYQATMRRIQSNRSKLATMGAKGAKGVDQLTSQIEQVRYGAPRPGEEKRVLMARGRVRAREMRRELGSAFRSGDLGVRGEWRCGAAARERSGGAGSG